MKRPGLLVAALLVLPLAGVALYRAGWCSPPGPPPTPPTRDERLSEAAWRWRDCQPNHWRDCLLQR
jgi:hypothetical protein